MGVIPTKANIDNYGKICMIQLVIEPLGGFWLLVVHLSLPHNDSEDHHIAFCYPTKNPIINLIFPRLYTATYSPSYARAFWWRGKKNSIYWSVQKGRNKGLIGQCSYNQH